MLAMIEGTLDPQVRESARAVITAKRDTLLKQREHLAALREQLLSEQRRNDRDLADCRAAARLFGLDIEFPSEEPTAPLFGLAEAGKAAAEEVERVRLSVTKHLEGLNI